MDVTIQTLREHSLKGKERLITTANNSNNNRIDLRTNRKTTNKILEYKNGKKNNCMDASSSKLRKLVMK